LQIFFGTKGPRWKGLKKCDNNSGTKSSGCHLLFHNIFVPTMNVRERAPIQKKE